MTTPHAGDDYDLLGFDERDELDADARLAEARQLEALLGRPARPGRYR